MVDVNVMDFPRGTYVGLACLNATLDRDEPPIGVVKLAHTNHRDSFPHTITFHATPDKSLIIISKVKLGPVVSQ